MQLTTLDAGHACRIRPLIRLRSRVASCRSRQSLPPGTPRRSGDQRL